MQLRDINARGRGYSEAQVKVLEAGTEELAKHSVYSKEILSAGEAQLAVAAVPPKYIQQAIGPMEDLLAVAKGTSATVEDMSGMAKSFGIAIKTGMTKQLKQFGIYLTPLEKQYLQTLAKAGEYQASYNFLLEKMKFAAGEAARQLLTPVGRIHKAQENIKEMGIRVRQALMPDQAAMEEAWSNAMLALEPALTDFERTITHVKTWAAQEFGDLVKRLQEPDAVKAANDFSDAVRGIGAAFGYSNQEGKSLGTMLGDWLSGELHQTAEDFINIERVVVNLKRHWKILEGEFIGGWEKITTALEKLSGIWEKFKESVTGWKPPWWMPGAAAVRGGQAIYKAGAGVRKELYKDFTPASPEDWAAFTGSAPPPPTYGGAGTGAGSSWGETANAAAGAAAAGGAGAAQPERQPDPSEPERAQSPERTRSSHWLARRLAFGGNAGSRFTKNY